MLKYVIELSGKFECRTKKGGQNFCPPFACPALCREFVMRCYFPELEVFDADCALALGTLT
jgi:hypothetical protein